MSFPEELWLQILLNIPYTKLPEICINNPLFYSICINDYFWKLKSFMDFGQILCEIRESIQVNKSWSKFYHEQRSQKELNMIHSFNLLMTCPHFFAGKIYDVTDFNLDELSGVKLKTRPVYRGKMAICRQKQKFLMPILPGLKSIPIGTERSGIANFENYVKVVISKSNLVKSLPHLDVVNLIVNNVKQDI